MFNRLACLVYYIARWVSLYLGYSSNEGIGLNPIYLTFHPTAPRLLGIDVSPTSLPQWSTLLFLLIFIMYKNITLNAIYYYSYTCSLMKFTFSIMFNFIYYSTCCWTLLTYNYFNFIPVSLYHIHTRLSYYVNVKVYLSVKSKEKKETTNYILPFYTR